MENDDKGVRDAACPDTDRIVDLCQALGTDPAATLAHLQACPDCRDMIEVTAQVRRAYAPDRGSVESLTERIVQEVDLPPHTGREAPKPARRLAHWGVSAANWVLAGLAGFAGVLVVSAGTVEVGPQGAVAAAVLTGSVTLVYEAMAKRRT